MKLSLNLAYSTFCHNWLCDSSTSKDSFVQQLMSKIHCCMIITYLYWDNWIDFYLYNNMQVLYNNIGIISSSKFTSLRANPALIIPFL